MNANVLEELKDTCFWDANPDDETGASRPIPENKRNRCPNFRNDTKGETEGTFPDVKLKHGEVIRRLRVLLKAMQNAGFPRNAPRIGVRPVRPGDEDADPPPFTGPADVLLLRIPSPPPSPNADASADADTDANASASASADDMQEERSSTPPATTDINGRDDDRCDDGSEEDSAYDEYDDSGSDVDGASDHYYFGEYIDDENDDEEDEGSEYGEYGESDDDEQQSLSDEDTSTELPTPLGDESDHDDDSECGDVSALCDNGWESASMDGEGYGDDSMSIGSDDDGSKNSSTGIAPTCTPEE
jgi:hypothetical protein